MNEIIRLQLGEVLTNTYIIKSQEEILVIDPAFESERIIKEIKRLKGYVKYIVNTHGHIDHISSNNDLLNEFSCQLLIHELDKELLTSPEKNLSLFFGYSYLSKEADLLLKDGDIIKVGDLELKVIHTPGHTEGSISLYGDGFIFTGDTLFYDSIGRTDFPGGNEKKIFQSLKKLSKLIKDNQIVYPGHGEFDYFYKIKKVNPFLNIS
ncbi:MAG: MBL fold metallo-hydrolase [candidate division WOR-3 bacterium]|nr:MBL fold metallo-hydrolase [candidate division WOR-3 bacterium]MDW8114320.1 MBL fold metallo-hydrolase [candidate division WOR-3 bacterium]